MILTNIPFSLSFPRGSDGKEIHLPCRRPGFHPWVGKDPLEEQTATPSSIIDWRIPWTEEPGGLYSPWGHKESDVTEQLSHSLV